MLFIKVFYNKMILFGSEPLVNTQETLIILSLKMK